jgi:hypothetical protein
MGFEYYNYQQFRTLRPLRKNFAPFAVKNRHCGVNSVLLKCIIIGLILITPFLSLAQEAKLSEIIVTEAEELASEETDPGAAEKFMERLYELSEDPVKINSGDEDEIGRLFFLNGFQVKVLADYIKTTGRIVSLFEIANIPGFDKESAELIASFITFEGSYLSHPDSIRKRNILLSNFTIKSSLSDTLSSGSPWKMLTKYKLLAGGLSGGFTIEKDPGERLLFGDPPVPDFFSAYITWQGVGYVKRIIIGDYSARFGLGTGINTGIRIGSSLTNPGYLAGKNEIRPCSSTDENNFFRGAAAEFSIKKFDMSFLFSSNKIDATLNDSCTSIKSLYKTGLHNSPGTIRKKDAANEINYGLNLSYNFNNIRTGILWIENRFSLPLIPESVNPLDKNSFKGKKNSLSAIYYSCLLKRFILFGEFSNSNLNKHAFIQGMSLRPSDRMNINFIYSNYSSGFVSFHGNRPAGSSLNNESAILGNITFEVARFLFISAGSEISSFAWLKYRCSAPSTGRKHEIRTRYSPNERLSLEVLYNYRYTMVDNPIETGVPSQDEVVSQSVRCYLKYFPADNLVFGTRLDFKAVNPSGSNGTLFLQDISVRFRNIPVSIWARYCIFYTGGFESGIYTWENDLLNCFSVPVMFGSGSRCYLMSSWKPGEKVEIRFKYAITTKGDPGNDYINTSEFKIQLKINI